MIRKTTLAALLILMGLLTAGAQQPKTDYSGTWKINIAKSDFGPLPVPEEDVEVIAHKEPSLSNHIKQKVGDQGPADYTVTYTTDGKETTNQTPNGEAKSTAKWDGKNMVVHTKLSFNDMPIDVVSTWTLSADGKVLTITAHAESSMGGADLRRVYDKVETTKPAP